ncbi:iron-containing alcohol dehydrogenase [Ideonella sp. A 288]|uniref:iron-containing alcohol dehydrogenase n=1 Tax=Ideonella sp. A 288 TaxID=1962181 RepID=UPI000B4B6FE3|nr:iron-containing alcohol dehydrogenase [Ideonella sp. A 288]
MSDPYDGLPSGVFNIPAQERIVHGQPAGAAVRAEAERLGATRVFVVSGRSLGALADGPLQRVQAALGERHAGTYAAVRAHSPREDVIAAAEAARSAGADLLVGVGGGSAIDAAKAVQVCLWQGLRTPEAMEPYRTGAASSIARPIDPPPGAIRMLAVSTTLSAPEFTGMAGITDSATQAKQMFAHRLMVPRTAILDPAATLHTPEGLLYSTAIRSVDHAVECWCSPMATPATEALSLQGLRLLARALPAIQANPLDLAPRLDAQFGMWQAVAALAAGVQTGASHGIGYALGAGFGVAHGHTSCVMLPAVLRWNAAVNAGRQQALAEAMGDPGRPAHELVAGLIRRLGQPGSLREVGLREDQLADLAQRALAYPPVQANPRPIRGVDEVREILALAW